jgi:hypothetical protein
VQSDRVHLVRRPLTDLLYQPRTIDDECGAVGGMRTGRGNRSTRRKPAPVPLCPPQIPHDLTWAWTRAAAMGIRRLTAWAMTRPLCWVRYKLVPWEIQWNGMDWIIRDPTQALVNTLVNIRVHKMFEKFWAAAAFSRSFRLHGVSYLKYKIYCFTFGHGFIYIYIVSCLLGNATVINGYQIW